MTHAADRGQSDHGPPQRTALTGDSGFAAVLRSELEHIRPDITLPAHGTLQQLYGAISRAKPPLSALCLSGGGIRSAAFALGVLQTLARYGVLGKFDYFSTVSGGGYIGSFLTAWRHRAGNDDSVIEGLDRGRASDGTEAPQIAGLRADSNYLTPKLGVLSADTWTVVALVVRNLILNWVVFLPFFMGVLLIPWLCKHALDMLARSSGVPWLVVGLAAICVGLAYASYGRRRSEGVWLTDQRFVLLVLCPIVVAAMGFSAGAAAFHLSAPGQVWLPLDRIPAAAAAGAGCYALAWLAASVFHPAEQGLRQGHPQSNWGAADFVAWVVAGLVAGVVLRQGIWFAAAQTDRSWLAALGISWTMLSTFAGELVYVGLRSHSPRGDMDREWLARAAGWLGAWAGTWLVIATTALVGPAALRLGWGYAIGAVGGVSGLVALVLGGGAWTAATNAAEVARRLSLTQIASVAGVLFALALAVLISKLDMAAGALVADRAPLWLPKPVLEAIGAVVLIGFSALASRPINVNWFSLHAVYRNRLVRAFLGSARRADPPIRTPDPFTNFDPADNPRLAKMPKGRLLHVVNVTLNVVSTDNLAWQERKAESFTLTPLHAGNPLVGYRPTHTFGSKDGGITLGTAMAISGAALSPNMGYSSSPLLGFLLMLFNVRLGWWLGNPSGPDFRSEGPRFGLLTMLQELANMTTATGRWIYLSDGGHFDNLGLYEMVRRRCRFIVVSEAGGDPTAALADLGNAVRKAYIDFGVCIRFDSLDVTASARPPREGAFAWIGRVWYPGSPEPGWVLYLRPTYQGTEPPDIRAYAEANPTFPDESTSEQWFGESQFEAYRALGAHEMEQICAGGGDLSRAQPLPMTLAELRERAEEFIAPNIDLAGQLDGHLPDET
jgi:hypothetical protein